MKYLEFSFHTTPCTEVVNDVLSAVLADAGFESFVEQPDGLLAYIQQSLYDEASVEAAISEFPIPDTAIEYSFVEAEDKDWNEEWEKNFFQPIVIGNRCVIHSTFHHDVPEAEYDVAINPQMAFGTGHHETTSLVIGEILDSNMDGKKVLDMGCGTSILAILARMKGVDEIEVCLGDASILADKGPFDMVIANINRNILLADMQHYVARMNEGATLLMSGFYVDDIPLIKAEAERLGLTFNGYKEKNRWVVTSFKR